MWKCVLAAFVCAASGGAQTVLLETFNAGATTGAVRTGTSWVSNTTQNATTLTVGGNARDDNGWGATGLSLNAAGMNFLTVTAQRDAGNSAATFAIQFEDRDLNTQIFSVSMSAFAIGSLTSVHLPITAWTGGFSLTQISGWSIGGGGVGTTPLRMTFDHLALNATATTGTVAPGATGDFGTKTKATGESITFSVTATGTAPLTYQWFKNSTMALSANATATTAALTLSALVPTDAGTYTCTVTNAAGSIVSLGFILSVTAQPATITLGALAATYTGTAKAVTATTSPAGLAVAITYAGNSAAPSKAGTYPVVATINDPVYAGTATGTLVIAKGSQLIALGALPANLVIGTPVTLNATATSGGAVTFAVLSGSATLSGSAFTPTGPALITLRASQAGSADYLPATADVSFTTTKRNQSIDFPAVADQPPTVTSLPLVATASSGAPVSFVVVSGPATLTGTTLLITGTGVVSVRGSQSGSDTFNAAPDVTRTFSVSGTVVVVAPPVIAQSPPSRAIISGGPLTLSVIAAGTGPLAYQWFKENLPLAGATGDVFTLARVTATDVGNYHVVVSNSAGSARSATAAVTLGSIEVSAAPVIIRQPGPQVAIIGSSAAFTVTARGTPSPSYQWRKNGVVIPSASNATLTLLPVLPTDVGAFEVVVTNASGSVTSSLASLTLVAAPTGPVITRQPADATAIVGRTATLVVAASATPAPTYQWLKDGAPLPGATADTLTLASVQPAQAGQYSVVLTNAAGRVTSRAAILRVPPRSYAGTFFGTLGPTGSFALHIRDDHTGVFLGFTPLPRAVVIGLALTLDDSGNFEIRTTDSFNFSAGPTFSGAITAAGSLTGTAAGPEPRALRASRSAGTGPTLNQAGYYDAAVVNASGRAYAIGDATGQFLAVTQTAGALDAGLGTIDASGTVRVTTLTQSALTGSVAPDTARLMLTLSGGSGATNFIGSSETAPTAPDQRLVNNSTRARAGSGDQVAIAGFVITGEESKPVLIRAVGPSLAGFGVPGAVAAPVLELFQSGQPTALARNTGWSIGGSAPTLAAAAARVGAFPLDTGTADAALLTTLAPGAYSAVISSADARAGVGLVEVYDLSGAVLGQRISNLSVRAFAGADADTLIVGVVVQGTVPKRLLIRAVGPGLTPFGVTGVVEKPRLAVFSGAVEVARNLGWSTSPDAAGITQAALAAGAFPLANGSADSALLINLAPGAYTAQVSGVAGTTGVALVEVYEVR